MAEDHNLLMILLRDERDRCVAEIDYDNAPESLRVVCRVMLAQVNAEIARRIPQQWGPITRQIYADREWIRDTPTLAAEFRDYAARP